MNYNTFIFLKLIHYNIYNYIIMVRNTRKLHLKSHHTHSNDNVSNLDRTMHSLESWTQQMFEKLGWIILAKSYGHYDKVNSYKQSVNRLYESLLYKLKHTHQKDRKNDLKVLIKEVKILLAHIQKDF